LDYRVKKINGKESLMINETLVYLAKYANAEELANKLETEKKKFINSLIAT
jgi:hypothetical protein